MRKELIRKSKFISLVLRHQPSAAGVQLDANGWVGIDALLAGAAAGGTAITRDELQEIVDTNEKRRFAISPETDRIRASQGHSIEVELALAESTPPTILYHGTATRFLDAILAQGLLRMQRHHVHLSADLETARKVGLRHGKPAILTINAEAMRRDGYTFFLSANDVWLVDSIPPKYLSPLPTP